MWKDSEISAAVIDQFQLFEQQTFCAATENPGAFYSAILQAKHRYDRTKRFIDLLLACVCLLFLLPLLLVIACAIKIDSPGPVFIRQLRIGKARAHTRSGNDHPSANRRSQDLQGRPFFMYKFRTMHHYVNLYDTAPQGCNDRRVTRIGKILRRLGLDELPQLANVLKGDMSLVGPRPEMPFLVARYNPLQRCRLLVKPGITGLWQIYAPRDRHIHEALHYDLFYILNRNLFLDSYILIKTLGFVLAMKNN